MKTTNLFKNSLRAVAAFLFAMTVALTFTACFEIDNPAGKSDPASSGAFDVTGMWYAETVAKGTIGEGEEAQEYTKVVQICEFQDSEDGLWVQYFINSDGDVIQLPGGIYIGQFIYSTHADGTIVFDITGEYGEVELVDTWTMKYADGHITGLVGSQVQDLAPATAAEKDQIKKWGLQIGLGGSDDTSYNINSDAEALKAVNKEPFTKANWRTQSSIYCWTRENIREDNIKDSNGGTGYYSVMLPWSSSGSTGTLPVDFCDDMVNDKDWNLVMNYCGRRYPSDANYMAFYHAYTGKLRIFYYIPEHAGNEASDHFFQVVMPKAMAEHSPFGYGIPVNGSMNTKNAKLIGANVNDANYLSQYITPYCSANSPMGNIKPTAGWYAFDIDLSLLRNNTFDANSKPIQFKSRCLNKSLADFYGTQMGSLDGSINLESCSVNSTGGVFGPLEDVLGQVNGIKDFIGGAAQVYSDVMSGNILGAIEGGINVAKQGCDLVGIDYGNETEGFNGYKGDVNLKLSTQIDLKGQITQETVMKGLTDLQAPMGYFDFDQTHLGEGVWNIVDHPVVYYTNAQIQWREEYAYDSEWGDTDDIKHVKWAGGKSPFGANKKAEHEDGEKYGEFGTARSVSASKDPWCGYVAYFDPSNIKVRLNPSLFTPEEIRNAKVYATCGVRKATSAFGSLDNYRAAFGLKGSKFGISKKNGGDYYNRPFDEAAFDALSSSEDKHGMQTGVTFPATKYDGYNCGMFGRGDESFILEPQPLSGSDHALMTYMPSYEVTVTVIVNHNGKPIVYSRTYLPEYVKKDVADIPCPTKESIQKNTPANYVPAVYAQQMNHIRDIYLWTRRTFQAVKGTSLWYGWNVFTTGKFDKYSESWPMLIDGKTSTKWCTTKTARKEPRLSGSPRTDDQVSWYAFFNTNYGISPTGYTFVNGGDTQVFTERRPRVWYIWGKKEEKDNWTKLAYEYTSNSDGTAKSSAMPNGNYAEKSYKFNEGVAKDFKYFLVEITSNWSADDDSKMQLSEFRFTYD